MFFFFKKNDKKKKQLKMHKRRNEQHVKNEEERRGPNPEKVEAQRASARREGGRKVDPGGMGAAGVSHDSPEPIRAHLRVPEFKNTTKIQRERPPREREKERKWRREREKKSEILGGPAEWGSRAGVPGGGHRQGGVRWMK